jgi:hypothetical protein
VIYVEAISVMEQTVRIQLDQEDVDALIFALEWAHDRPPAREPGQPAPDEAIGSRSILSDCTPAAEPRVAHLRMCWSTLTAVNAALHADQVH